MAKIGQFCNFNFFSGNQNQLQAKSVLPEKYIRVIKVIWVEHDRIAMGMKQCRTLIPVLLTTVIAWV